jgi:hypothetical protein
VLGSASNLSSPLREGTAPGMRENRIGFAAC